MAGLCLTAMSRPGKHNALAMKPPDGGYLLSGCRYCIFNVAIGFDVIPKSALSCCLLFIMIFN